jgi:hypothetical protein
MYLSSHLSFAVQALGVPHVHAVSNVISVQRTISSISFVQSFGISVVSFAHLTKFAHHSVSALDTRRKPFALPPFLYIG